MNSRQASPDTRARNSGIRRWNTTAMRSAYLDEGDWNESHRAARVCTDFLRWRIAAGRGRAGVPLPFGAVFHGSTHRASFSVTAQRPPFPPFDAGSTTRYCVRRPASDSARRIHRARAHRQGYTQMRAQIRHRSTTEPQSHRCQRRWDRCRRLASASPVLVCCGRCALC